MFRGVKGGKWDGGGCRYFSSLGVETLSSTLRDDFKLRMYSVVIFLMSEGVEYLLGNLRQVLQV